MKPALVAAITTVVYLLSAVGVFKLIDRGVPPWAEAAMSLIAAPGVYALLAWVPLLKRLGLAKGEMVTVPGPLGFALIAVLYAAIAFIAVSLVVRALRG